MAVWLSGNAFVSINALERSYSTSVTVSAWMGDRFMTSKPPRRRTSHAGQSGHPTEGRRNKYTIES